MVRRCQQSERNKTPLPSGQRRDIALPPVHFTPFVDSRCEAEQINDKIHEDPQDST